MKGLLVTAAFRAGWLFARTVPEQVAVGAFQWGADLATRRFGRLDVLASIAGVAINAHVGSGELDDWNQMIDVNLRGVAP